LKTDLDPADFRKPFQNLLNLSGTVSAGHAANLDGFHLFPPFFHDVTLQKPYIPENVRAGRTRPYRIGIPGKYPKRRPKTCCVLQTKGLASVSFLADDSLEKL
jgi:hypothetical protein